MHSTEYHVVLLFLLSTALFIRLADANQTVEHWSVNSLAYTPLQPGNFSIDIYSPTTPGVYSVLVFLTGFSGLFPPLTYNTTLTIIAEQNVIVIAISKIEPILPDNVATTLTIFLDWLVVSGGARQLFVEHKSVNGVTPDVTNSLAFMSHSQAAQSIATYLNRTCGYVQVLIMLSPVDGIFPFAVPDAVTDPPHRLSFKIPALIIADGLDNAGKAPLVPACAPSNISNDRFYQVLCGPTFLINITNIGHADYIDGLLTETNMCAACTDTLLDTFLNSVNTNQALCNKDLVHLELATIITTFVGGIFDRNSTSISVIENPATHFKNPMTSKYDLHGYDYSSGGPGGFCVNQQLTDACQVAT